MRNIIYRIYRFIIRLATTFMNFLYLASAGVKVGKRFTTCGMLFVRNYGKIKFGDMLYINSSRMSNPAGVMCRTTLFTGKNGSIVIGNNVGISNASIISFDSVTIEDDVIIGSGSKIYDTDFHSTNEDFRLNGNKHIPTSPVVLKKKCFVGSDVTILKGVTIGEGAVIGACSIVTKDVPDHEIWAGNPAHFIKKVE